MKIAVMLAFMALNQTFPGLFGVSEPTGSFSRLYLVQDSAPQAPSDIQLQQAVTQAMQSSQLTANSQIVVHVTKGEVTLEGSSINQLARREATRLAETVIGVKGIRNRLNVIDTQTAGALPPS